MNGARRLPVVTLLLVTANILAAFALLLNPDLSNIYGFSSKDPVWWTVVTSQFLHANTFHLLGNMLFLAAVGSAVEISTGWLRFALVYLLSGIAGVALHFLMTRGASNAPPLIGASGCIAGCIGYYALRYQAVRVPVVPKLALSVLWLSGLWLALQVIGGIVRIGDAGGTAYWAHIGGFGMGVALSLAFRTPDFGQAAVGRQTIEQMAIRGPAAVLVAAQRHLEAHPNDIAALHELVDANRGLADPDGEAVAHLRIHEIGSDEEKLQSWLRLMEIHRLSVLPINERRRIAGQLPEHLELAVAMARSVLEDAEENQRPDAQFALASLIRDSEPELSRQLLNELSSEYPLHPTVEIAKKRGWLE